MGLNYRVIVNNDSTVSITVMFSVEGKSAGIEIDKRRFYSRA